MDLEDCWRGVVLICGLGIHAAFQQEQRLNKSELKLQTERFSKRLKRLRTGYGRLAC